MIRYGSDIVIDRPHSEVATYVLDAETHGEWMGDVAGVEILTPGEVGVGGRARYSIRKGPMSFTLTIRVETYDPKHGVTYATEPGGPLDWSARMTIEPIDAGRTRVTSAGEMSLRGIRRVLEPFMAGEVRAGEAAELVALKRVLEARPAGAAAEGLSGA